MRVRTTMDDFHVPEVNLTMFQIDRMSLYGNAVALVDAKTEKQYTFSDIKDRTQRLAEGLRSTGLRQGDVLCAVTFNTIEYHIIWYAVNLLGATFQTASPLYTDADLERMFRECNTTFLITIPELTQRFTSIISNMKHQKPANLLSKRIVLGEADGYIPYISLFSRQRVAQPANINPKTTTSILLSSSGTTGLPKFVQLTHVNIIANILQCQECMQHRPGETLVLALPIFHHYGIHTAVGVSLYNGVRTVLLEKWDVHEFFKCIHKYKANILPLVPTMAARLVKFPERHRYDLSSVRYIHSGAAPLGAGIEKRLKALFNVNYIANGYGSTEAGHCSGNNGHKYKSGSCGFQPKGIYLKIVDPNTGERLPANQTGEIYIRGPSVTIGYLNNPDANRHAITKEGFFKTGDLGYVDSDGFLFIVDRLKDLVKYKGLQVSPAYLEDIIVKHPDVADAAIVGIPDDDAGELPKAFVVLQQGSNISAQDIITYVSDQVAPHMRLRGGADFVNEIPRTASGKIVRRMLRDKYFVKSKL